MDLAAAAARRPVADREEGPPALAPAARDRRGDRIAAAGIAERRPAAEHAQRLALRRRRRGEREQEQRKEAQGGHRRHHRRPPPLLASPAFSCAPRHYPLAGFAGAAITLRPSTILADQGWRMKAVIERATLLKGLGHVHNVVERRNTIPILSNVSLEAGEDGGLQADGDRSRPADRRDGRGAGDRSGRDHRLRPHPVRYRPQAARGQPGRARRRRGAADDRRRPLPLQPADPAARRFPGDRRGRAADPVRAAGGDAPPDHRQDQVRDLDRGDALLSERHLPPRLGRGAAGAEGGGDRRPPARPRHRRPAGRGAGHAGRHHPAQMRDRAPQAARRGRRHGRGLASANRRSASASAPRC